ncbi:MAG: hypothetical protein ACI9ON_003245 [Limisphaerales bacterium]|jgi:hypothetical protein
MQWSIHGVFLGECVFDWNFGAEGAPDLVAVGSSECVPVVPRFFQAKLVHPSVGHLIHRKCQRNADADHRYGDRLKLGHQRYDCMKSV